jgi:hypothetical protein
MKKIIGCALIAGLALGCSHAPNKNALITETPSNVVYIKKGDREPAGAPELIWRPATVTMQVTSQASNGSGKANVNQEMIWTETEQFTDTRNEYREYEVPGQCSDFVCSAGSAKSALWDNYFAATKERKSAALAAAIQGIGGSSADALIAKRFFSSKPATWQAFANEINRAAQAGVIQKSVATGVLTTYKYENISNLGYARESCREVVSNCTVVISKLVSVPFTNTRQVPRSKVVQTKTLNVNVQVTGAVLMSTEVDKLSLKISENGTLVNIESSGYNRYSLVSQNFSGDTVSLVIKSDSRIMRDLPNSVIRQDSYQLVGGVATFVLDVDQQFVPNAEDPNSQLVVDYKIRTCEYGWTGLCGPGWDTQAMASAPITSSRLVIPMNIPPKHKSDIQYTVVRKNSMFFNDRGTSERSTDNVKLPK